MHLFKSVLKKNQAERAVLDYVPQKFELGTPQQALEYLEYKRSQGADFKMSDATRIQTGVAGIEQVTVEQRKRKLIKRLIRSVLRKAATMRSRSHKIKSIKASMRFNISPNKCFR
jgi:hypothetical protein